MVFTESEITQIWDLFEQLSQLLTPHLKEGDEQKLRAHIKMSLESGIIPRDVFGLNPIVTSLQTAFIAIEEEGLKRDGVCAILLYSSVFHGLKTLEQIKKDYPEIPAFETYDELLAAIKQVILG